MALEQTKSEYDIQAEKFLTDNKIEFSAVLKDTKKANWDTDEKPVKFYNKQMAQWQTEQPYRPHFEVTLSKGSRKLTFDFWSSIAHGQTAKRNKWSGERLKESGLTLKPYGVLASISSESSCPDTFEDFCSEFGYDTDSIKAKNTFETCVLFAYKMRNFFTSEELEQLQEIR